MGEGSSELRIVFVVDHNICSYGKRRSVLLRVGAVRVVELCAHRIGNCVLI